MRRIFPSVHPLVFTLACVPPAWLLVATGCADSPPRIFGLMGAVFAPVSGAIAADFLRQKRRWPGPRPGWRPSAVAAWAIGMAVGLAPEFGLIRAQPATILAFSAAFLVEILLGSAPNRSPQDVEGS
ncbi:MAG: hypothetical protein U0800_17465 [Isosphaeraceae bacterium]